MARAARLDREAAEEMAADRDPASIPTLCALYDALYEIGVCGDA